MAGNINVLKDLFILTRSKINKEPVQTIKEITEDRKKNCIRSFREEKDKKKLKTILESLMIPSLQKIISIN